METKALKAFTTLLPSSQTDKCKTSYFTEKHSTIQTNNHGVFIQLFRNLSATKPFNLS